MTQPIDDPWEHAPSQVEPADPWLADCEGTYFDPTVPPRECDCCHSVYTGPSVYCSYECALRDAK